MQNLSELRDQIDFIDHEILKNLEKRMQISQKISTLKTKEQLETRQISREKEIYSLWLSKINLCSPKFIKRIVRLILKESRKIQKNITNQ
jgi:chorismate mutase